MANGNGNAPATMEWVHDDGGRKAAGFTGTTGDCVTRAIAIASGRPYREVYDALFDRMRKLRRKRGSRSPRNGVPKQVYHKYLLSIGFEWVPTMQIGSGCKVHLLKDELPGGTLIVRLSKHLTCVKDGIIHDTYNPQRGKTYWYQPNNDGMHAARVDHVQPDRCVYGYYRNKKVKSK